MTRPARNRLLVVLLVVGIVVLSRRAPDELTWASTLFFAPVVVLALWVTAPLQRARSLHKNKQFDEAALAVAEFEKNVSATPWKLRLAGLAVGLYTSSPLAAARNVLGAIRLDQGKLDEAEMHLKASLEHDALYALPWANLAVLANERKDVPGAQAALKKARELGYSPKLRVG